MKLTATLNGVDLSDAAQIKAPGLKVNYFNCPWTLSNPGHGRVLMSHEQLAEYEETLTTTQKSTLLLKVGDEPDIELKVYPVKAEPLWNHCVIDAENNLKGMYLVDLLDERCIYAMHVVDDVQNSLLAIFNAKDLKGEWYQETLKSEDTPFSTVELFQRIMQSMGHTSPFYNADLDGRDRIENLYVGGIPATLAADLLLLSLGEEFVFKFKPTNSSVYMAGMNDTAALTSLIEQHKNAHITGGWSKYFKQACVPSDVLSYLNAPTFTLDASKDDIRKFEFYVTTVSGGIAGTQLPTLVGRGVDYPIQDPIPRYTYKAAYAGFHPDFLEPELPLEQVIFHWQSGAAVTEVYFGSMTPAAAVTSSPYYYKTRGVPHRLFVGGDIFLPDPAAGGGDMEWGNIVECNEVAHIAKVRLNPDAPGEDIIASSSSVHQVGDQVRVARIKEKSSGHTKRKWTIVDFIGGFNDYLPPGGSFTIISSEAAKNVHCTDAMTDA